jgi:DNA-binding SARP family transcriptional activator
MMAQEPTSAPLAISLFGPFSVLVNGAPLPRLRWRKQEALLALLTLRHDRPVERTWLAALLWPEASDSQGLATLRRYLTGLRSALGPAAPRLYAPTPATLSLDLTGATVDLIAFDAALDRGAREALGAAVSLYRGPLLEGWTDDWVVEERSRREQAYLQALERLAIDAIERDDPGGAEQHLRQVIAVDPLRESAQRALMRSLACRGNATAATQVYQELRRGLHRELNAEPDAETTALFQQLREEARGKAVLGARCSVLGEGGGSSPGQTARPTLAEHRAPSTEHCLSAPGSAPGRSPAQCIGAAGGGPGTRSRCAGCGSRRVVVRTARTDRRRRA